MSGAEHRPDREPTLDQLPSLMVFGERLVAADPGHSRARGRRGTTGGAALLGALLALTTFSGAAALALTATTGNPVPSFARGDDVSFYPAPGSTWISDVRAADPDGAPPWTVRVGRSGDGLVCVGVGQVQGAAFGVQGLDGVFRETPPAGNDACGPPPTARQPVVALRTFSGSSATAPDGAATVVYGTGGAGLRAVSVTTGDGARHAVPVGRSGTFVAAVPGWVEGAAPVVRLRWTDGRARLVRFGASGYVPDPGGRYGWSADVVFSVLLPDGRQTEGCVRLVPGRGTDERQAVCVPRTGAPARIVRVDGLGGDDERRAVVVRTVAGDAVTVTVDGRRVRTGRAPTAGPPRRVVVRRNGRTIRARRPYGVGKLEATVALLPAGIDASRVRVRIEHRRRTTTVTPRPTGDRR